MNNRFDEYIEKMRSTLPIGESFDVSERKLIIGGRAASMFFVDGLSGADKMQRLMVFLLAIKKRQMLLSTDAQSFMEQRLPYMACEVKDNIEEILKSLLSGLVVLVIDGYDKVILIDEREYPARGVEEPEKEKTLRGAKDGFTETLMTNVALIRRRVRDHRLVFAHYTVGQASKSDVCLVYMKGVSDESVVQRLNQKLKQLHISTVTVGEQTLVEVLSELDGKKKKRPSGWLNPFPKVRYTQRPDVVAAHITEGKVAIMIDNTPTIILLPTGIFDFMQDVDDYYFPAMTGNYFRLLRIGNFLVILFLTPIYLLVVNGYIPTYTFIDFIIPENNYAISLFGQFLILEISIDALKLASLNTPNSLGMSLSVIGALILGEFSIQTGWFIPQTILCMAVVALSSFTQPSMELQYGVKFMRLLLLFGAEFFGFWGCGVGLVIGLVVMGSTKTLVGTSYFYPLIPFNKTALTRLLFRSKQGKEKSV